MSIQNKRQELIRLQTVFETEAAQFNDLSLSILYLVQKHSLFNRVFRSPNHVIMLWQYYGLVNSSDDISRLFNNVQESLIANMGLRGSEFSCYAVLEGSSLDRFIKMAVRAGSIFSDEEKRTIHMNCFNDFESNQLLKSQGKPVSAANDNPLAIWLNHVLHHLGKTHPGYLPEVRISLDPFAASLLAIDSLLESETVNAAPLNSGLFEQRHFNVALSFPGEKRSFVQGVAEALKIELGNDTVFYDNYYQPELARPNLDILLQRIYHENSDLVVVFLCKDYEKKEWCGLEWRAIRDLIKQKRDDKIMILRFDNVPIQGLFGIDGSLDISTKSSENVAKDILHRLKSSI